MSWASLTPTANPIPSKRTIFYGWQVHALDGGGSSEDRFEFVSTKALQYMLANLNKYQLSIINNNTYLTRKRNWGRFKDINTTYI